MTDKSMTVVLPFPPSTNALFTNRRGGRAKTPAYERWIVDAGTRLMMHRPKVRFTVPVVLRIELVPPDRRRRDTSNFIKAPEDLLIRHGVIQDDSMDWIKKIIVEIGDDFKGCRVTVTEWNGAAA